MDTKNDTKVAIIAGLERKEMILKKKCDIESAKVKALADKVQECKDLMLEQQSRRRNIGDPRSFLRGVGSADVFNECLKHTNKKIHVLEHRLQRITGQHDRTNTKCGHLRLGIDVLRKDMIAAHQRFDKLAKEIESAKNHLAEALTQADEFVEERKVLEEEIADIQKRAAYDKQRDDVELDAVEAEIKANLENRHGDTSDESDAEDEKNQTWEEMAMGPGEKLKRKIRGVKGEIKEVQKYKNEVSRKYNTYKSAFGKLARVTGITDTQELVDHFLQKEERNFGLYKYVQQMSAAVEEAEKELEEVRGDQKRYLASMGSVVHKRSSKLMALDAQLKSLQSDNADLVDQRARLQDQCSIVADLLKVMFDKVGCNPEMLPSMMVHAEAEAAKDDDSLPPTPEPEKKETPGEEGVVMMGGEPTEEDKDSVEEEPEEEEEVGEDRGLFVMTTLMEARLQEVEERTTKITTAFDVWNDYDQWLRGDMGPPTSPGIEYGARSKGLRKTRLFHILPPEANEIQMTAEDLEDLGEMDHDSAPDDDEPPSPGVTTTKFVATAPSSSKATLKPLTRRDMERQVTKHYHSGTVDVGTLVRQGRPNKAAIKRAKAKAMQATNYSRRQDIMEKVRRRRRQAAIVAGGKKALSKTAPVTLGERPPSVPTTPRDEHLRAVDHDSKKDKKDKKGRNRLSSAPTSPREVERLSTLTDYNLGDKFSTRGSYDEGLIYRSRLDPKSPFDTKRRAPPSPPVHGVRGAARYMRSMSPIESARSSGSTGSRKRNGGMGKSVSMPAIR